MANRDLEKIFAAGRIAENSFEAQLGKLCHDWIMLIGLDAVVQGLDDQVQALSLRQDIENQAGSTYRPPAQEA